MDGHWPTICSLWCCFVAMDGHWHTIILFAFSCFFGASRCFVIGATVDESNLFFQNIILRTRAKPFSPALEFRYWKLTLTWIQCRWRMSVAWWCCWCACWVAQKVASSYWKAMCCLVCSSAICQTSFAMDSCDSIVGAWIHYHGFSQNYSRVSHSYSCDWLTFYSFQLWCWIYICHAGIKNFTTVGPLKRIPHMSKFACGPSGAKANFTKAQFLKHTNLFISAGWLLLLHAEKFKSGASLMHPSLSEFCIIQNVTIVSSHSPLT